MTAKQRRDITALGAHGLTNRELLKLAGVHDDEVSAAERALALIGMARDSAVRALRSGPRLAAAIELGRRAWMLPSPAGRRVRAPVDVAAICAPRFVGEGVRNLVIALDRRLTVARVASVELHPALVLRETLAAASRVSSLGSTAMGTARCRRPTTRASPRLIAACALVDVALLDVVLLGDDGFASLTRLGLVRPSDPRYR